MRKPRYFATVCRITGLLNSACFLSDREWTGGDTYKALHLFPKGQGPFRTGEVGVSVKFWREREHTDFTEAKVTWEPQLMKGQVRRTGRGEGQAASSIRSSEGLASAPPAPPRLLLRLRLPPPFPFCSFTL